VPVNNVCIIGDEIEDDGEWQKTVSLRNRQITVHEEFIYY
jgi:hypothetical protein